MAIGAILAGAGFATQILGNIQTTKARLRSLKDQARVAEINAALAQRDAEFNAGRQSLAAGQIIAGTKADYAAAGFSGESGSVLAVLANSYANAELDRLSILHGGNVRSFNYAEEAASARKESGAIRQAGLMNLLSSGLNFASSRVEK